MTVAPNDPFSGDTESVKKLLERLLALNPTPTIVLEGETIIAVSPSAAECLGLPASKLTGTPMVNIIDPASRETYQELIATAKPDPTRTPETLNLVFSTGRPLTAGVLLEPLPVGEPPLTLLFLVTGIDQGQSNIRLRELEKALATMQVGVTITDTNRHILYVNPAEARMHGYEPAELLGEDVRIFAPKPLLKPMAREELKHISSWRRESVNIRKDGSVFPVEMLSDVVLGTDGEPVAVVSICQDITDRKRVEAALRESEERFALAMRGANDGLWDWDLEASWIFYSDRWKSMIGFTRRDIGSDPEEWFNRVHPEDMERLEADIEAHLTGRTSHFENEHRILCADGTYHWMLSRGMAVFDESNQAYRMAGSMTDITERKVYDPLTHLPNRALFQDRLNSALARARRWTDSFFAVLYIDLDRFKVINDSVGHIVGDHLLVEVARVLEAGVRIGDTVARLGGDEFAILLEQIHDVEEAIGVIRRIEERFTQPFQIDGQDIFTSMSVGIALSTTGYSQAADIMRDADTAMYRAKSQGRARYQIFDAEMRTLVQERMRIEVELRHGLERGELVVHYQPIIAADSGRITAFEALVRWNHPERGLLLPGEFIHVAEDTGIIIPLGEFVLDEACRQLRQWHHDYPDMMPFSVSVNVSPRQFHQSDLVAQVQEILDRHDLQPEYLELEITESVFIADRERACDIIRHLRELGVRVCIDDFGTGYSSLSYLQHFPVNTLKIDRSFTRTLGREAKSMEMVRAIINMARELGLNVIAEGVENDTEFDCLKNLACRYMQGFSFSRPVPADDAAGLLRGLNGRPN